VRERFPLSQSSIAASGSRLSSGSCDAGNQIGTRRRDADSWTCSVGIGRVTPCAPGRRADDRSLPALLSKKFRDQKDNRRGGRVWSEKPARRDIRAAISWAGKARHARGTMRKMWRHLERGIEQLNLNPGDTQQRTLSHVARGGGARGGGRLRRRMRA